MRSMLLGYPRQLRPSGRFAARCPIRGRDGGYRGGVIELGGVATAAACLVAAATIAARVWGHGIGGGGRAGSPGVWAGRAPPGGGGGPAPPPPLGAPPPPRARGA